MPFAVGAWLIVAPIDFYNWLLIMESKGMASMKPTNTAGMT